MPSPLPLVLALMCGQLVIGSNVLILASCSGSTWLRLASIGEALHDRKHSITVLTPENNLQRLQSYGRGRGFTFRTYQTEGDAIATITDKSSKLFWEGSKLAQIMQLSNIVKDLNRFCVNMLDNTDVAKSAAQFDVVLADFIEPCGYILPHVHRLPSVVVIGPLNTFLGKFGVPSPIAYVPSTNSELTDDMDFWDRTRNSLYYIQWLVFQYFSDSRRRSAFSHHLPNQVLSAAMSQVDLVLVNRDFALEFPGPTSPNVINIGGIAAQPALALTDDLESFMVSSGGHGVILFSLGTYSGSMPAHLAELFAGVFSQLPQKVLWKHNGETPTNLGTNTRTMKWIPQNDILGHEKTKLFITHCGGNGMYEAVYHAVPMVFLPLAMDQPDNAVRGVARGLGVKLDIKALLEKELLQSINTVLYNDRPMPSEHQGSCWISRNNQWRGRSGGSNTSSDMAAFRTCAVKGVTYLSTNIYCWM
ncbi:UGT2B7 [Branchiostoma lanceolatum]|uniref:UDP-glucuronosyltransferase n=1 Tax=Branchiostoma lanceolatum TaxID=7740 RepID=A0A8K0EW11_BRALA|nr:UGT2B7 [Branchiostoma lanceolatum]